MANIVIVDDSPLMRKMLHKILSENGHTIIAMGKDGNEGLELFSNHKPDLLLLDITMPNKSGVECLEEVLRLQPDAKVVMFSSNSDESSQNTCLSLGAKAFLAKDVNLMDTSKINEILKTINLVLES